MNENEPEKEINPFILLAVESIAMAVKSAIEAYKKERIDQKK